MRSEIVREACITIAYLAKLVGQRLERFAEQSMNHLINLLQNSAIVMASCGCVAIRFIIKVSKQFIFNRYNQKKLMIQQ